MATLSEGESLRPTSQADLLAKIIGRPVELRQLFGCVDTLPQTGGALLVRGEPGIGKTVLLDATRAHATEAGLTVLETVGLEAETSFPFSSLRDLLAPLLSRTGDLPRPQEQALLAAFGELDVETPPQPFLIALAALNLVSAAAEHTAVVIVADDAQWLDLPTHEVLAFMARRIAGEPIALVIGWRDGHSGPLLESDLTPVPLQGLDDRSARQLVEQHGGDLSQSDRDRILHAALGNPLALVELPASRRTSLDPEGDLSATAMPLSERLERAFASRLDELPDPTRNILLVAAVDSENGLQEILAGAEALGGDNGGASALVPAVDAGLLTHDHERIRFRHPLVRSGIMQSESLHRRHQAHRALAQVLSDDPYRSAWHRAQATVGKDDRLADELEDNHIASIRRGSVQQAIAALERSAQLTTDSATRGRRLLLAAEHAFGLGRADIVDRLLRAAGRNTLTDLERARMEWLREIFNDGVPGDAARVLELCRIARQASHEGDVDLSLNLLLGAALRCWWAHAGDEASQTVVSVADELPDVSQDCRHTAIIAVAQPNLGSVRVRRLLSGTVLERTRDADELRLLGMAAHAIGDPVLSVDLLDRSEAMLRQQGRLGLLSHVLTMGILDRIELGELAKARAAAEEGRRIAQETGQPIWDIGTLSIQAMLSGIEGETEKAHAAAAEAEQLANGRRLNDLLACVQLARGFAFCSSGQYADAFAALRRVFDPIDPAFHESERFHGVMYLAEAAVHSGNQSEAARILQRLRDLDQVVDAPALHMHLTYADAVLADDDHAEAAFRAALGQDLVRWPLLKARLELAFGSWLRRQRRVTESRLPLRYAQVAFEVMGARAWDEQAQAELRAAGLRPSDPAGSTLRDLLSAQEYQIAELVAEGLSNREIGERLYLSPRTVGSHLYRMFPKLGVTSRSQLASKLSTQAARPVQI